MTNYIKYWNNAEEVVYWFREWGMKAWLSHGEIVWKDSNGGGYMKIGQTAVAHNMLGSPTTVTVQ